MARLQLHNIKSAKGSTSKKKRVGRGLSSKGKYCGRGMKGQKSRSGSSGHKLRGLRMTMLSTPKVRGFKSQAVKPFAVNLAMLDKKFVSGELVTPKTLIKKGLVPKTSKCVKILGAGNITKKLAIKHCILSKQTREKVEAAGGSID